MKQHIDFLKNYLLHLFILTLVSLVFRIYFAWDFGWLSGEVLKSPILFGLRFDLAISAILSFLFTLIVFLTSRPKLYAIPYVLLLACLFADKLYFQESHRHLSYEVWDFINGFFELATYFINFWHYFLLAFLVGFIISVATQKLSFWNSQYSFLKSFLGIFLAVLITVVSVRGGFRGIAQNPGHAFKLVNHTHAQIALNGAYAIFYSLVSGRRIKLEHIELPKDLNPILATQEIYKNHIDLKAPHEPQKYNIILIFLEGWPAEYIQSYGGKENVTPEFEAIRKKSITTAVTIAGGKRTTEGMFATLCSYQNPLGKTIMFNHLEGQKYNCLPEVLRNKGWFTGYLQGTNNMTSGVGAFTHKTGVTLTGGKKEFPRYDEVEKNSWGLYDRDLYDWVIEEASKVQEPFFFSIGTNTTHDLMLRKGEEYKFGEEPQQNKAMSVLHSADKDLGDFVRKVESLPWKNPVLFVLVSDHTSHVTSSNYNSFRVPFAIYSKNLKPQFYDFAISQRDIAPTILDLLGMPTEQMTGISIFDQSKYRIADYYSSNRLGVIVNESFVEWNIKNPEDKKCYDWRKDYSLSSPRDCTSQELADGYLGLGLTFYSQKKLFDNDAIEFFPVE